MKLKFWSVFLMVVLMLTILFFGGILGYVIGYQDGARDAVEYASKMIDKVSIDNLNIDINQTTIDNAISELKNITERLITSRYNCTSGGAQCP